MRNIVEIRLRTSEKQGYELIEYSLESQISPPTQSETKTDRGAGWLRATITNMISFQLIYTLTWYDMDD